MTANRPTSPTRDRTLRLTRDMVVHLRAAVEGVSLVADGRSLDRTLTQALHAATLIAQRTGQGPRVRLMRMRLWAPATSAATGEALPTVDDWAASEGLEDWSHDELLALYAERFPRPAGGTRKAAQIDRLRRARLELLATLEQHAVDPPALTDPVSGWFTDELARRLNAAGFDSLAELRSAIAQGGRWWRGMPGFGPVKARALADELQDLVGRPAPPAWARLRLSTELAGAGPNRGLASQIDAADDQAAIAAFLAARTHSPQTARAYQREAERFLLWLLLERQRPLSGANADDCRAYMAFLNAIPPDWISKRAARRLAPGWAPFSGQPSIQSQRYALAVLGSLFRWLVGVGYLKADPWVVLNTRIPDARVRPMPHSRAFTPEAWAALQAHLDALASPAAARMRFLLAFSQGTGLRATELLHSRLGDLRIEAGQAWLAVYGKGARHREVPVPSSALEALRKYFHARELEPATAHPDTPLLAVLNRPELPGDTDAEPPALASESQKARSRGYLSYTSLHSAFTRFVRAALRASALPHAERERAMKASTHWLRHTHATQLVAAGVPIDVVQANLGHASPETTAVYFHTQEGRRAAAIEAAFSSSTPDG